MNGSSIRDVLSMLISNVNKFRKRTGRNDQLASATNEDVSRNNKTSLAENVRQSSIKQYQGSITQTMPLPLAKITSATKKVTINLFD